jgi:hypothetical protein
MWLSTELQNQSEKVHHYLVVCYQMQFTYCVPANKSCAQAGGNFISQNLVTPTPHSIMCQAQLILDSKGGWKGIKIGQK